LLLPELFRLVLEEIGTRPKRQSQQRGAIAGLVFVVLFIAGRGLAHALLERAERLGSDPGLQATENIQPIRFGYLQNGGLALKHGFGVQRNPKGGRAIVDAVAEKPGRSDAHNGHRMALDEERGADHVAAAAVGGLPGCVADDSDRRCAGDIVGGLKHAAGISANSKRGEVVARDVFGAGGFCHCVADSDVHRVPSGLEGGELFELGSGVL
jgi:hypothetical protein